MGRYKMTMRTSTKKIERPHPIWRGIGCLIIIIVPILSFAAASLLTPFLLNRGMIPNELLFTPQVPDWLWFVPVIAQLYRFLFGRFGIVATLLLTFLFMILIGGIFSVLYAFMYRFFGPKRYGPLDAPPPKVKVKKYKR